MKTLLFIFLAIVALCPQGMSQTGPVRPPHPLVVSNGTGDGSYTFGHIQQITAPPTLNGSNFVMWITIQGARTIANPRSMTTTVKMMGHPMQVAAIYANAKVWYPEADQPPDNQSEPSVGLFLPKKPEPEVTDRREMKLKAKIETGELGTGHENRIFEYLCFGISWFPELQDIWHSDHVEFYDSKTGGNKLTRGQHLSLTGTNIPYSTEPTHIYASRSNSPTSASGPSSPKTRTLSVWYEPKWSRSDMTPRTPGEQPRVPPKMNIPTPLDLVLGDAENGHNYTTVKDVVSSLPATMFKLRDEADFIKGWDDTGKEPWTSVGVGKTSSIVKFIGGSGEYELVVDPASANYISISNEAVTGGDTNFDIKGIGDSKNAGADGAKIIFRKKGTANNLAVLHVHVLPARDIHFTVYHASDEGPGRVPLSAIPAGVPTPATIGTELNDTYRDQVGLNFIATSNAPVVVSNCDGCFYTSGNCFYGDGANGHGSLLVEDVIGSKIDAKALALGINVANSLNIVIVNNVIRFNPRLDVDGITGFGIRYPFVDANANIQTFAHETGHCLKLSSRSDPADDPGNHHDPGPDPQANTPIMGRRVGKPRTHWLRQEDWRVANDYAGANYR